MKNTFFVILFILCSSYAWCQMYEMESNRYQDLGTKSMHMEKTNFTIDSNKMSLHTGDQTFYYDKKTFSIDDNGTINMVALDKNDAEVMIKFSPEKKLLDYYLGDAGIRYFLDKVEQPKPEVDSATAAKNDTTSDEEKALRQDTMIYDAAEVMPEYPGGHKELMNYLAKTVKYPSAAKKTGVKGFVTIEVIVEKDGSIKQRRIKKDIGGGCGEEALRAVKAMPNWTPGEDKGEAVRVRVQIPVSFMPPLK